MDKKPELPKLQPGAATGTPPYLWIDGFCYLCHNPGADRREAEFLCEEHQ